ncbi:MAG: lipid asymmetry maintenance protein MlaB [Succinivibrio sp.]
MFRELSFATVPELWKKRAEIFKEDSIDLKNTSHIDSAGIAFLLKWAKTKNNGKLVVLNASKQTLDLIHTYKLNELFEIK